MSKPARPAFLKRIIVRKALLTGGRTKKMAAGTSPFSHGYRWASGSRKTARARVGE